MKIKLSQDMITAIMSLAKAIIQREEELKALRKTEDQHDLDERMGYQKCEECND